jgi:chromate transporter
MRIAQKVNRLYIIFMPESRLARYVALYFTFFKIGAVTFGGGLAMLPILERELVAKRAWTTSEELLDYFAIAQSVPGIIAANVAMFVGYKRGGILGAIVALAGIVTPSLIIIMALAASLENFTHIPAVKKALAGINVAVAALLTSAVWSFGKKAVKDIVGVLLFLGAFAALFFFKVNSAFIILFGTGVGITLGVFKNRKLQNEKGEGKADDTL